MFEYLFVYIHMETGVVHRKNIILFPLRSQTSNSFKKKHKFLLIIWEFHIMHPSPTHLSVSQYQLLIPVATSKRKY